MLRSFTFPSNFKFMSNLCRNPWKNLIVHIHFAAFVIYYVNITDVCIFGSTGVSGTLNLKLNQKTKKGHNIKMDMVWKLFMHSHTYNIFAFVNSQATKKWFWRKSSFIYKSGLWGCFWVLHKFWHAWHWHSHAIPNPSNFIVFTVIFFIFSSIGIKIRKFFIIYFRDNSNLTTVQTWHNNNKIFRNIFYYSAIPRNKDLHWPGYLWGSITGRPWVCQRNRSISHTDRKSHRSRSELLLQLTSNSFSGAYHQQRLLTFKCFMS